MSQVINRKTIDETAAKLNNWGKWGKDDQIGTLNYVGPAEVAAAAKLVKSGKVFPMGIPLDGNGPQRGLYGGRWNPIHQMMATGSDAIAGKYDSQNILGYADDSINMPVQAATHWDALGHIFYKDQMYNGYSVSNVDSRGVHKNGIEHTAGKMIGRGVLLDVARFKGKDFLEDGYGIPNAELDATAKAQGVEIRKGDFVIIRTGQMEQRIKDADWGGYAGGDAPGVEFENCFWSQEKQIAAICSDTWGVEVRPNKSTEGIFQPWHWIVIPSMGLTMGEMFYVKDLAEHCAKEKVYEFFFCAPPLVITGGTGSPINPQAIF